MKLFSSLKKKADGDSEESWMVTVPTSLLDEDSRDYQNFRDRIYTTCNKYDIEVDMYDNAISLEKDGAMFDKKAVNELDKIFKDFSVKNVKKYEF